MDIGLVASREVGLEGGRNFRDLGGYTGINGKKVRWGQIYRSGSPIALTAGDWEVLKTKGICAICDLRTVRERQHEPFIASDNFEYAYWGGNFTANFAELRTSMAQTFLTAEDARAGMIAGYRRLPFDLAGAYRQLFTYLVKGDYPLLFNCSAGKDRTGVGAALILLSLGVSRQEILADYELTNTILARPSPKSEYFRPRLKGVAPDISNIIGRADPSYLLAALAAVGDFQGGFEGYAHRILGLAASDITFLQDRLLS